MMPPGRTTNAAFKERGIEDVVKIDVFPLQTEKILVTFESIQSDRPQGIWLKTDGGLYVNNQHCPSVSLWYNSAPNEVICQCVSSDNQLFVYNIWEKEGKRYSLSYSSGMLIEEIAHGRRYRCNDTGFATKFDKIVFRIEHVREAQSSLIDTGDLKP